MSRSRRSAFQVMGVSAASDGWKALTDSLGLAGADVGQRRKLSAGVPPLAGLVEKAGPAEHPGLLLRLDEPAPGTASLFALPMGGQVFLVIDLYLYGDRAATAVARDEPLWTTWMKELFPA